MFSVCISMAPRDVDHYPGSDCAGGGAVDQHYRPLGMFSVCKSMVHRGFNRYPGSECAGGSGGDQQHGLVCSVCVRALRTVGLTTIRGQSVRAALGGINILDQHVQCV